LQPFEVRSQISGVITQGRITPGEFISENQMIFVVADLSVVWVDCLVPLRESNNVKKGQEVVITSLNGKKVLQEKLPT
jgi:multidrug resistance efflux pump